MSNQSQSQPRNHTTALITLGHPISFGALCACDVRIFIGLLLLFIFSIFIKQERGYLFPNYRSE